MDGNFEGAMRMSTEDDLDEPLLSSSSLPVLPINVLAYGVLPFVADRATYNVMTSTCKELREKAPSPPWPDTSIYMTSGDRNIPVQSVVMSVDRSMIAYASFLSSKVFVCDRNKGPSPDASFRGHTRGILSLAFSSDGKYLASSSQDRSIILWPLGNTDSSDGNHRQFGQEHRSSISAVSFTPDSKMLASGSMHNVIRLWLVETCQPLVTLHGHGGSIVSISLSDDRDGRLLLASGSMDNTVRVWNCTSLAKRVAQAKETDEEGPRDLPIPSSIIGEQSPGTPAFAVYSPDGKWLATTRKKSIALKRAWPLHTTFLLVGGHDCECLVFSPNSKQVVSGSSDWSIRMWQIPPNEIHAQAQAQITVQPSQVVIAHKARISSITISADNKTIISGDAEGHITIRNNEDVLSNLCFGSS